MPYSHFFDGPAGGRAELSPTLPTHPERHTGRGLILGVALEYCRISKPLGRGLDASPETAHHRYRGFVRPGCFAATLADVCRGRAEVLLCLGHDIRNPVCSTRDGSLAVWSDADGLYFGVAPTSAPGRHAIRTARRLPTFRKVSIGYSLDDDSKYDIDGPVDDPETVVRFRRARLTEISLVPSAAFPGTYCRVY
jgi:HK97 family phage prohead protease